MKAREVKRQKMVDEFNDPHSSLVAFLLSSKAGGCGKAFFVIFCGCTLEMTDGILTHCNL